MYNVDKVHYWRLLDEHKLNKEAIDGYTEDCKEDQKSYMAVSLS